MNFLKSTFGNKETQSKEALLTGKALDQAYEALQKENMALLVKVGKLNAKIEKLKKERDNAQRKAYNNENYREEYLKLQQRIARIDCFLSGDHDHCDAIEKKRT